MEKLKDITFYTIDKAIRSYRIYAQKKLKAYGFKITIDQWLVIKSILENPNITQQEIGELVFKDNASVTRIIEILVQSGYVERTANEEDRRKTNLKVTTSGKQIIKIKNHDSNYCKSCSDYCFAIPLDYLWIKGLIV